MRWGDPNEVTQNKADTAVAHVTRSLKDVAFLPTISAMFEMLNNPGARGQTFIDREVGSLVPALVRDAAQVADPVVRRPTSAVQAIEARVPGLTQRVPPVVDITGQPVRRPASSLGTANPIPISTAKNESRSKRVCCWLPLMW